MMTTHVSTARVYYTICGILLFCTYLTVQMAYFDLGVLNVVAALTIAGFKASLVVLFFMHMRDADRLTKTVAMAGLFWFGLLLFFTLSDYLTRSIGTFG
jgi:cytochrome c oxidase subunit 4